MLHPDFAEEARAFPSEAQDELAVMIRRLQQF